MPQKGDIWIVNNHIKNDGAISVFYICECFIGKNSVVNKTKFSDRW